ncbi:MAG: GNAT family N-acetyltransferase [Anaerolineaceae bacterium]|nr:GNAT family N-acetyltransferase [Anaerolineaceae bacterium]
MEEILIRPYRPADQADVEDICYRTGHMGADLSQMDAFNDRELFALLFIRYYLLYEPEHGFVAEDPARGRVVGYIVGTTDTAAQERAFARRVVPRVLTRLFLVSWWHYPESFRVIARMMIPWLRGEVAEDTDLSRDYPAHLHINVLADVQRGGIGSRLLEAYQAHLRSLGVMGLHLGTSSENRKALPFYAKHGFTLAHEAHISMWPDTPDARSLTFVKKLQGGCHQPL